MSVRKTESYHCLTKVKLLDSIYKFVYKMYQIYKYLIFLYDIYYRLSFNCIVLKINYRFAVKYKLLINNFIFSALITIDNKAFHLEGEKPPTSKISDGNKQLNS